MLDSLGQVLPSAARRFGDKIALVIEGRSFSFRELDELSNALAASLVKLGVRHGDRVTLYAPNSWEWIVSYYGALKTGAVINPVNVMLTPAEVAYVTKDCGAKVLIGSPEKIAPALAAGVTGLRTIVFGNTAVPDTTAFNELVAEPIFFEAVAVDPNALSTIGYTSGTTGHPKGAMQSHRAVMLNAAMTAQMHAKSSLELSSTRCRVRMSMATSSSTAPCSMASSSSCMRASTPLICSRAFRRTRQRCSTACPRCTCTCSRIPTSPNSISRR
jgi:long-chain acyl-CoA synthetase